MKVIRLLFKFLILPIFLVVFFNFLEYGFKWNRVDKFIYPAILAIITLIVFLIPKLRKLFFIFSFLMFSLMVLLYLLNKLNLADIVGSFGFALLLIVISSYIPEIIKKGFVERF